MTSLSSSSESDSEICEEAGAGFASGSAVGIVVNGASVGIKDAVGAEDTKLSAGSLSRLAAAGMAHPGSINSNIIISVTHK